MNWQRNLPMLLSAFVYPGVGQCVQRRWTAGIAYGVLFTLACGWFCVGAFPILAVYYSLLRDDATVGVPESGAVPRLLVAFALMLIIYVINLVDVIFCQRMPPSAIPPLLPHRD